MKRVTCPTRVAVIDSYSFIISKAGSKPGYWAVKSGNSVVLSFVNGDGIVNDLHRHREQVVSVFVGIHVIDIVSLSGNVWGIIIPKNTPKIAIWTVSEGFVQI